MPEFTVIEASAPTELPASQAKTYDRYWIKRLIVQADDPARPVKATVTLRKSRTGEDSGVELSPVDRDVVMRISDLMAAASQNAELAEAVNGLMGQVRALAQSRNLI